MRRPASPATNTTISSRSTPSSAATDGHDDATEQPAADIVTSPAEGRARLHTHTRWRRAITNVGLAALYFALSLAGAALAVCLFGAQTFHWRAFDIEASLQPSMVGETRLVFAPLGEVRARTHSTPVAFYASLRGVTFDEKRRLVTSPPPRRELETDFKRAAREAARSMFYHNAALGAAGALVVPLVFRFRRTRYWILCAVWGAAFVSAITWSALRTYNPAAFENPTYTGSLRQANWIITLVKDGFNKAEALSDKLRNVAANLNTLYGRINALPDAGGEPDAIRILHISDIHNNPAAVKFVLELAGRTGVDAVVDTGDLTDFGSPVETSLSQGLARLPIPYVFVAGNHDSRATVAAVRANSRAVILNGTPVNVGGLRMVGAPDPSADRDGPGSVDTSDELLREAAARLSDSIKTAEASGKVDLVCVHNRKQATAITGTPGVVLCGHVHRAYVEVQDNTVFCNAGTTGAAGARYFDVKHGVALSAAILAFSRRPEHRLLYIDLVSLDGSFGQYSITRRTFSAQPAATSISDETAPDVAR